VRQLRYGSVGAVWEQCGYKAGIIDHVRYSNGEPAVQAFMHGAWDWIIPIGHQERGTFSSSRHAHLRLGHRHEGLLQLGDETIEVGLAPVVDPNLGQKLLDLEG
jgi:hypothetical protein